MPAPDPLDLHHLGDERVIGVYLLETEDGLALQDCGPSTCIPALKERLAERGLALTDLRHLLLSHIHLDHAGAAGRARPRAPRPPGARLRDRRAARRRPEPARVERAAALRGRVRLSLGRARSGSRAERPRRRREGARARLLPLARPRLAPRLLPGRRGNPLRGDAAGVRIMPDRHIWPVSPPPEVDLDAWERTIDEIELRAPERLALIHFGVVEQPRDHLRRLRRQLRLWGQRVRQGMDEDEFVEAARADLEDGGARRRTTSGPRRSGSRSAGSGATGTRQPRRPARSRRPSAPARSAPRRSGGTRSGRARPPARAPRPSRGSCRR